MKVNIGLDDFRKCFENNFPGFILRLRDNEYENSYKNADDDLVYYDGNKAFEVKPAGKHIDITFPINTYKCNTTSVIDDLLNGENYMDKLIKLCEGMSKFFKFEMSFILYNKVKGINEEKDAEIETEIDKRFKIFKEDVQKINPQIKVKKEKPTEANIDKINAKLNAKNGKEITNEDGSLGIIIIDNLEKVSDIIKVQYRFIVDMRLTGLKKKRNAIKDCNFDGFIVNDIAVKKYELEEITNVADENSFINTIKMAIESYRGKGELEKKYQHQFMLCKNELKSLFPGKKIYPFEQEYGIVGGFKKDNTTRKNGRVDTIFYALNENNQLSDIYFIELKVNKDVVGGDNGVMTHLDDIKHFLDEDHQRKNINRRIKYRHNVLYNINIDTTAKIKYYFYTVIGFTKNDDREIVENWLKILNSKEEIKTPPRDLKIPETLKNKTIEELRPNKSICEVRFFYEEQDWNKNNITGPFVEYEIGLINE